MNEGKPKDPSLDSMLEKDAALLEQGINTVKARLEAARSEVQNLERILAEQTTKLEGKRRLIESRPKS